VMAKKLGVKAIITSGYNTRKADLEAARTSGILYLPKPWVFKELVEIMGAMMGTGNPKAEIRGARGDTDCILMFAHEARAPMGRRNRSCRSSGRPYHSTMRSHSGISSKRREPGQEFGHRVGIAFFAVAGSVVFTLAIPGRGICR